MGTDHSTLALGANCARELARLEGVCSAAKCRYALEDLGGILGFIEIDCKEDIVGR
jgi:hypothetical protein